MKYLEKHLSLKAEVERQFQFIINVELNAKLIINYCAGSKLLYKDINKIKS